MSADAGVVVTFTVMPTLHDQPHHRFAALLAHHPSLPPDAAHVLASHPVVAVRTAVAGNAAAPAAVNQKLLADRDVHVRRAALRTTTDRAALEAATGDRAGKYEKAGAAANPSTPVDVLAALLTQEVPFVAREALMNPATPVRDLLDDRRLATPTSLTGRTSDATVAVGIGAALAAHPELCDLWSTCDATVRRLVARTPGLSALAAARIADRAGAARHLGGNPWIPVEALPARSRASRHVLETWLAGRTVFDAIDADPGLAAAQSSPTVDFLLSTGAHAANPAVREVFAARGRRQPGDPRVLAGSLQVEPDVLAHCSQRGGPATALAFAKAFGVTRVTQAAKNSPILDFAWRVSGAFTAADADELAAALASTRTTADVWPILLALVDGWTGTLAEALQASVDLAL